MCELGQNRKRTHGSRQSLSQLFDALHISIVEKLGGLRQVGDAAGISIAHYRITAKLGQGWVTVVKYP